MSFLPGYKSYIVGALLVAIGVVEGVFSWNIPGVEVGDDWLMYILNGMGVGSLRAAIAKVFG